jgi:hypothetical protein
MMPFYNKQGGFKPTAQTIQSVSMSPKYHTVIGAQLGDMFLSILYTYRVDFSMKNKIPCQEMPQDNNQ